MRPYPRVIGFCILAFSLLPLVPPGPGAGIPTQTLVRTYDGTALQVAVGQTGAVLSWPGMTHLQEMGRPDLPADELVIEPPLGMTISSIEARAEQITRVTLPALPAPYTGSLPLLGTEVPSDQEIYAGGQAYPESHAVLTHGGFLRGRRLETIRLHPVRYLPGEQSIQVAGELHITVTFASLSEAPVVPRDVVWEPVDRFSAAAERLLHQPGPSKRDVAGWKLNPLVSGNTPFSPRFVPSVDGSPVRFLIITDDAMASEFQRLADWKTALGMPTVVRTVSWIAANYPRGFDHGEEIRNFIREAVEMWGVEYVLLGGDVENVSPRFAKSYFFGGENIPADLYFMCLDGNWNSDGDDLFGEPYFNSSFPGDGADLYPEVWAGRLGVRSSSEAGNVVDKIIAYETLTPTGSGFGDEMLVLGEMLFPQNWSEGDTVIFDGAVVAETAVSLYDPANVAYRMYENHNNYPGSILEHKPDVVAQINAGYNMVLHVGHGFRNTMAVGLNGLTLVNADVDGFHNGHRQGLLYAINCTSSAFDFDCIAEHLVRNPNGGVAASVGSSRLDFPATGWNYQNEFFDLVYNQGITVVGEAAAQQKFPFIGSAGTEGEHRWTQFSLLYMGDPTMDLYTRPVGELIAVASEPYEVGQGLYTVTVTDAGSPVEGAVVCLNKAGDAYGYSFTDALGIAQVAFDPDFPGPATFGVRAHNYHSRVDSITVLPPVGEHLFTEQIVIDDSVGGDGNGNVEAGESAFLNLNIGNQGNAASGPVNITVLSASPELTVADGNAAAPAVPAGGTVAASDPLEISADVNVMDESVLTLTLRYDAGGYTRDETVPVYVGGPALVHETTGVTDTIGNGDGNGVVGAGEDLELFFVLENRGLGRSIGAVATLTTLDPAVTIFDGVSVYGDIGPNQIASGSGFHVQISDGGLGHLVDVEVTDQRGVVLQKQIELAPPAMPFGLLASGGATNITLSWTPNSDGDLAGYNIYRAPSAGGPFVRANSSLTDKVSYYRDEDLPPLTRQYYQVVAVDASGNESNPSGVAEATTSLSPHASFPLEVGAAAASAPCLAFLSGDGKAEVVTGGNEIYIAMDDGTEYLDGDNDARTYGIFSNSGVGPFWSPPSVGDLEGDGVQEIVCASWNDGLLYVWNSHGGVKPGWPKSVNVEAVNNPAVWSSPALADIDGDGDLEILINAWRQTYAFHHDGTEVVDGDNNPATLGVLIVHGATFNYSTPAVADIDNDLIPEIIVGSRDGKIYAVHADGSSLPGFPHDTGGEITGSPAIGDLDQDGMKEIVVGNGALRVHALNANLVQPPGWPVAANMNQDLDASPALADMDGDGFLDVIVCAGNGTVYMWHGQNGALFPGWAFVLYEASGAKVALTSSPAVGNLDADPELEVCFGGQDGNLYAYNIDASKVDGFPIGTANSIEGGPLLWDIDDDGFTEVVAHSLDQNLYVWNSPGVFDPDNQPWPMFHRNSHRSGDIDAPIWVVVGVGDERELTPRLTLGPNLPNPFSSRTAISFNVPADAAGGVEVNLSVFDVSGRKIRTVTDGRHLPGDHTVTWDGTGSDGRSVGAGVYFYRLVSQGESITRKLLVLP